MKLWEFETRGDVDSSPVVAGDAVYVGSDDNKVYALDAATGAKRWVFKTSGDVDSSPVVAGSVVYVASYDKKVYALDAATGAKRWEFKTGDWVRSSPAVAGGAVYVESKDGKVYAFGPGQHLPEATEAPNATAGTTPSLILPIVESRCGDGFCILGENQGSCCRDCGCPLSLVCLDNECVTDEKAAINTPEPTEEVIVLDTGMIPSSGHDAGASRVPALVAGAGVLIVLGAVAAMRRT